MKFTQKLMIATLLGAFAASGAMADPVAGDQTNFLPKTEQINFSGEVVDQSSVCTITLSEGGTDVPLGIVNASTLTEVNHHSPYKDFTLKFGECKRSIIKSIELSDTGGEAINGSLHNTTRGSGAAAGVGVAVYHRVSSNKVIFTGQTGTAVLTDPDDLNPLTGAGKYVELPLKAAIEKNAAVQVTAGTVTATMTVTVTYN